VTASTDTRVWGRPDSRRDRATLPFCQLTISAPHPKKVGYPTALVTIGDHIRKRRLDLGLFQRQVAAQIGVDEASVWNWEKGEMKPESRHLPAIISFLGYNPLPQPQGLAARLIWARSSRGLNRVSCAVLLGVDPSTLARWETGRRMPAGRHLDAAKTLLKAGPITEKAMNPFGRASVAFLLPRAPG